MTNIRKIAIASRGVPRTINILCDTALVYAFATESTEIGVDIVELVLSDKKRYGVFSSNIEDSPAQGLAKPRLLKP